MNGSVRLAGCPSAVCLSHPLDYVPIIVSSLNFQEFLIMTELTSVQRAKVRGQRSRSQRSTPNWAVSGPHLQFEFKYDDEIMHRAWCCLRVVSYCFSRSSVTFQGHTSEQLSILTQIGRFRTVTPVWINKWLRNDVQSLTQHRKSDLLFYKVICQISRSHGTKVVDFDQIGIYWWLWNDAQSLM